MKRARRVFAILMTVATIGADSSDSFEWTIESGMKFELSRHDLKVSRDRGVQPIFSLREILEKNEKEFQQDAEERARELLSEDAPHYPDYVSSQSVSLEPLSAAGPIISYLYGSAGYSPGALHPYSYQMIETVDLSKNNSEISLLDLYPEKTILEALKADAWIRKFEVPEESLGAVETVAALAEVLNKARYALPEQDSCDMDAYFDQDLLRHFAFYDVPDGKVAIRIGISYGSEICRGTMHQIGLLLPAPPGLETALNKAARMQEGFLMKDRKKLGSPVYSATWEVDLKDLAHKLK